MAKRLQIRVGSGQGNQVILNHPDVATEHLELFADAEGNVFITDLGSDQGVYVNGDRLQGFLLLKEGDMVTLGKKIRFNWQKYRINEPSSEPKTGTSRAKVEMNQDPVEKQVKRPKVKEANLTAQNKSLYIIYGIILFLILLIYLIN
jgi:pSer/pThr/pTyr-binding forkhead associated (FHA) protein